MAFVVCAPSRASAQESDLTVVKSGPASAAAGSNVAYTINVINNGPDNGDTVTLTDPIPGGMTFVSLSSPPGWSCTTPAVGTGGTVTCDNANVPSGANVNFTLTVQIPPGTPPGTFFTNISTITSVSFDPIDENNSSATGTSVAGAASADVAVTKTAPSVIAAGQNIVYSIQVANSGPDAAASVTLSDTLAGNQTFVSLSSPGGWSCTTPAVGAGGTVNCSNASLAAGAGGSFTLTTNVPGGTANGTFYENTATVTSATDPTPENDSATAGTMVVALAPDLAVTKSHSSNAIQGQTGFVYTINVTNPGTGPTTAAVTVQDTLPAGMTATAMAGAGWNCVLGTLTCNRADALAAGAAYPPIALTVNVAANASSGDNVVTVATAGDSDPSNDVFTDPTVVTGGPQPDLAIVKSHTGTARRGQTGFIYTLAVRNNGTAPTSGSVTVSDTLPTGLTATAIGGAGWSCAVAATPTCSRSDVLSAGAAYPNITLTVSVASDAPPTVTNVATVSAGNDANAANDTSSDPTTVTAVGIDLSIAKTHNGNARAGQTSFPYTITVSNVGTVASSGTVTVTDILPPKLLAVAISGSGWACSLGATPSCSRSDALAANATYPPVTLTVKVAGDAPPSVTNTAVVSGGGDINPANNTANDQTNVLARADPTKDPDVVGLVNAQLATAQRFATTQISNFNERLEALHEENTGDQFGVRFGSSDQQTCNIPGTNLPIDPSDPKCQNASQYAAETPATDAFASLRRNRQDQKVPPAAPRTRDFAFWTNGYVSFGSADPTRQSSGIEFTTSGISAGADYRFSRNFVAGLGLGYGTDRSLIGDKGTRSDAEALYVAAYGSYRPFQNIFIDGVGGYGSLRFDSQRFVVDDAAFVYGQRSGNQWFGSLTTAYQYRQGPLMLSPYARLNAAWVTLGAFTETGGFGGALAYSSQTADFYTAVLGLRGKYTFLTDWGSVQPRFRVEYHRDFSGSSNVFLQYTDLLGPTYLLTTTPANHDRMSLGAGTDIMIRDVHRLGADYQYDTDFGGLAWHRFRLRWSSRFCAGADRC